MKEASYPNFIGKVWSRAQYMR